MGKLDQNFHICLRLGPSGLTPPYSQPDRKKTVFLRLPLYLYWSSFITATRSKVYCPFPANLDDLEANLRREVANLDPNMLTRALGDMVNRAQLCVANNGGYFEKRWNLRFVCRNNKKICLSVKPRVCITSIHFKLNKESMMYHVQIFSLSYILICIGPKNPEWPKMPRMAQNAQNNPKCPE